MRRRLTRPRGAVQAPGRARALERALEGAVTPEGYMVKCLVEGGYLSALPAAEGYMVRCPATSGCVEATRAAKGYMVECQAAAVGAMSPPEGEGCPAGGQEEEGYMVSRLTGGRLAGPG